MIYLDNAATSWPKPDRVYEAVDTCLRHSGGNPGRGGHRFSLQAGRVILETRERLAQLFNISDAARLIFTGNVTEALNLALKGFLRPGDHLIQTSMEHNAVARPAYLLKQRGVEQSIIPCSTDGSLDLAILAKSLRVNTRLICINHASNVTGTIQPLEAIGAFAAKQGIPLLVDCAQTAGILPIDVVKDNISMLAFTGHKGLLGPQGIGGLYMGKGIELQPLKEGGTGSKSEVFWQPEEMPDRFESGTLNTPGIAGLGAGVNFILQVGREKIRKHEQALTQQLIEGLRNLEGVIRYGPQNLDDQTAVISLNFEGWSAGELSYTLDQTYNIAVRSGLHCAPLAHATIGTLKTGTLRISPGYFNTPDEIEKLLKALHGLARKKSS